MKRELASHPACSLFRRAVRQVRFIEACGFDSRGILPDPTAKTPLESKPPALGSLLIEDLKML